MTASQPPPPPHAPPRPWPPPSASGGGPRFPDDGTWPPAPYRSAAARTTAASVIHGLAALSAIAGAFVTAQVFALLDKLERFQLTQAEEERWLDTFETVTAIEETMSFVAIISLMAWLSRSVDNAPALGGGIARRGPRWAIGAWFIPIVNVVMPALILRDLARRVSPDVRPRDRLVLAWWLLYWAPVVIAIYSVILPIAGTDSIRDQYALMVAIGLVNALGYAMTIVVMRRLQRDAEYWAERKAGEWRAARAAADAAAQTAIPRASDGWPR